MKTSAFITDLSRRLRDVSRKQWDDDFLLSALNAALRAIVTVIPQAYTEHRTIVLQGGCEQQVPDDLHRIVRLIHNVNQDDGQAGKAITLADVSAFDSAFPQWRSDKSREYIRHWMNDGFDESKFYVWPPAEFGGGEEPIIPEIPIEPEPVDPPGYYPDYGDVEGPYDCHYQSDYKISINSGDANDDGESLIESGRRMFITIPDEAPNTDDAISLNRIIYEDHSSGGDFRSVEFEGGTLLWSDVSAGGIVGIDWSGSSGSAFVINPTISVVEQDQYDQYIVDAAAYTQAYDDYLEKVSEYEVWASLAKSHKVRGSFTKTPYVFSINDSDLPVKDAHLPALQEFAMYYAYSIDDDGTANSGRAQRHWLAFFQLLNKREDSKLMIANVSENEQ